jgi:small GTP-binding protein
MDLALIVPFGAAAAYALDTHGNVSGLKLSRPPEPQRIIEIAAGFQHLRQLVIQVGNTDPVEIPAAIGSLEHLRFLWLSGNVKKLPEQILRLDLPIVVGSRSDEPDAAQSIELQRVAVSMAAEASELARPKNGENAVARDREGPEETLESMDNLSEADRLRLIEVSSKIIGIFLEDIKLEDPPLEIVARGRDAVASYFRDRGPGSLRLNEVKVLLVGHGSSGKTSLVKRVFEEKFDPKESQTHGINIRTLRFGSKRSGRIKANFWDFGGQEIMHATHQFFLSKRSLYVLVLDGRKEEDAEYWLQHIQSFGGDSPVMVVLNKVDEHPAFEVNRRFLTNKYPAIVGFFRISCASGAGIGEFREALRDQSAAAPILQTSWPAPWFNVKRRLQRLDTDYISIVEYDKICAEEGVTDQVSRETLVEFLNDLGVVLHFKDLQLLDTHVLDPKWVTEGVYRIINSELVAKQRGLLRLSQLGEVFGASGGGKFRFTPDRYGFIVELMLKFELCYKLDGNAILVPDLLDIQEPEARLGLENALRFVFEYQYLPKSVMPRLIVRLHKDIRGNRSWRTGVELEDKSFNARALVKADEKAKKITISVEGEQKRDYLSIIRKAIGDINSSFEKLAVTEFVPLPDAPEVLLEYKELIGFEIGGRDQLYVGRVRREYSVQSLLNGIEDETSRRQAGQTIINVKGDYITQATVGQVTSPVINQRLDLSTGGKMRHEPQAWEKAVSYATAFLFIATVVFLLVRNQPIADPNLVVALRILLSLMVAIFGASVPGMLKVDFTTRKGIAIRAMGALALFVISFVMTPKVLVPH